MTDFERSIIDYAVSGRSLSFTREVFGWRPATFVHELHRLLDRPDVEEAMPVEVHALQRIRDKRIAARRSRRFVA
jgi:hypothetical protein